MDLRRRKRPHPGHRRDDRGRKQYIYHPRWQEVRNQAKFNRLLLFGEALPQLRAQIDRDLRRHGLPRERVVAAVVRLLEETLIRVGNEQYARQNGSYGLTTLHTDHVEVTTTNLHFEFRGKSGQEHAVKMVAEALGNTAAICRDYYIHPAVIDAYEEGALFDMFQEASEQSGDGTTTVVAPAKEEERQVEEQVVLHLLRHHLAQERE